MSAGKHGPGQQRIYTVGQAGQGTWHLPRNPLKLVSSVAKAVDQASSVLQRLKSGQTAEEEEDKILGINTVTSLKPASRKRNRSRRKRSRQRRARAHLQTGKGRRVHSKRSRSKRKNTRSKKKTSRGVTKKNKSYKKKRSRAGKKTLRKSKLNLRTRKRGPKKGKVKDIFG